MMNSTNKKLSEAVDMSQSANRQAGRVSQIKPVVSKLKTAVPARSVKRLIAPTVHRPQQASEAVQPELANGVVNRKSLVAPPVYRPQPVPKVLQKKSGATELPKTVQPPRQPIAPPIYDPVAKKIVQPQLRTAPKAPSVYRPTQGKIAQPKMASLANVHMPPQAPPVYHPTLRQLNAQSGQPAQMKAKVIAPLANAPRLARRQIEVPGGNGTAERVQVGNRVPFVGSPTLSRGSNLYFAPGQNNPAITHRSLNKLTTRTLVIQRMDGHEKNEEESLLYKLGSFLAPKISQIFNIPNIFEMSQFTACVCLVFNQAGLSIDDVMKISGDYRKIFEQVKEKWEAGKKGRLFKALCPYDSDGKTPSPQFRSFSASCAMDKEILGPNPLIVVIGHCSPGSSSISGDKGTGLTFSVTQVLDVIRPLMIKNCTILLTPCSTAVSKEKSHSFQERFIHEVETNNDPGVYVIGMNSISAPIGGTILSSGYTIKHSKGGNVTMEQYKGNQPGQ